MPCDLRQGLGYVLLSNTPPAITLTAPGGRAIRLPYPDLSAQPTLSLKPCAAAGVTLTPAPPFLRCGAFATDPEDGDISPRLSVEQLHACEPSATAAAGACVFCSAASMDLGLCPGGRTYVYRYSVLDSDSNMEQVDREVVVEAAQAWVATSALFRNPRRDSMRVLAAYEAQEWLAAWPDAVSKRAKALMHAVGGQLGGRFLPEDVRVEAAEPLFWGGVWIVNVTLAVAVTGRHALPWFEQDAYMADLRASVRGGSAAAAAADDAEARSRLLTRVGARNPDQAPLGQRGRVGGERGRSRRWGERGPGATTAGPPAAAIGRRLLQDGELPLGLYPAVAEVQVRVGLCWRQDHVPLLFGMHVNVSVRVNDVRGPFVPRVRKRPAPACCTPWTHTTPAMAGDASVKLTGDSSCWILAAVERDDLHGRCRETIPRNHSLRVTLSR